MRIFKVGDIIRRDEVSMPYTVKEVDTISTPLPRYRIADGEFGEFSFWDYCFDWQKVIMPDEALRYGEVLTDDMYYVDGLNGGNHRIRTISYDNRIFYHKTLNGEVVEFKELTV